ncbi:hypothetical protein PF004_g10528 [Phytophthora fragariae]|uniref:Uncharacterized protein n=1 Tax=Phytophthora fragariae TaxID=53985 RepID=A0A6G0P118_9STRA|nr:hypothetical protein PF004_g10528 [Phytophthora fragariae]
MSAICIANCCRSLLQRVPRRTSHGQIHPGEVALTISISGELAKGFDGASLVTIRFDLSRVQWLRTE